MSRLVFDGAAHTLTLFDSRNRQVGQWHANNVVDHRATLRFVPNRTYDLIDRRQPHRHGGEDDTPNGRYGSHGIFRLENFPANGTMHSGVGVHSGRANRGGADHATMGCIRTSDEAMAAITAHARRDPLSSITIQNNRDQRTRQPHHEGDHHRPTHAPAPATPSSQPSTTTVNTPMT